MNSWGTESINHIEAGYHRSADTHLLKLNVPKLQGVRLYLKDESTTRKYAIHTAVMPLATGKSFSTSTSTIMDVSILIIG